MTSKYSVNNRPASNNRPPSKIELFLISLKNVPCDLKSWGLTNPLI